MSAIVKTVSRGLLVGAVSVLGLAVAEARPARAVGQPVTALTQPARVVGGASSGPLAGAPVPMCEVSRMQVPAAGGLAWATVEDCEQD